MKTSVLKEINLLIRQYIVSCLLRLAHKIEPEHNSRLLILTGWLEWATSKGDNARNYLKEVK